MEGGVDVVLISCVVEGVDGVGEGPEAGVGKGEFSIDFVEGEVSDVNAVVEGEVEPVGWGDGEFGVPEGPVSIEGICFD